MGPLTALAFVLIIGKAERFQCGKQVASYLGLVPLEDSSGDRRRLGHITKQGSSMLRFLLVARLRKALSASWGRPLTYADFVLELRSPATCCVSLLILSQLTVLGIAVDCCSATCFRSESTLQIRGIVDLLRRQK